MCVHVCVSLCIRIMYSLVIVSHSILCTYISDVYNVRMCVFLSANFKYIIVYYGFPSRDHACCYVIVYNYQKADSKN